MTRASLATALQAYNALHERITADADALALDTLITWLDLFAHIERVDAKLSRSAQSLASREDDTWTDEQRRVIKSYARDVEARRRRRNGYIGWSMMLRRHYINTLLARMHEESTAIRQPFAPLLTSHIYPLFPPSEINDYSLSEHLFVRNTEEGEKALVDRTVEGYEEVIVSYDDNGDWRPSYLPHAKPLQEIMHAMHRYVHSVASSSRRLKRAFPEAKENENGHATTSQRSQEASRTPQVPPEDTVKVDRVVMEEQSLRKERKSSSRRREESRATRAVLAFFGAEEERPASPVKTIPSPKKPVETALVAAIQVEVVPELESEMPARRSSKSRSRSVSVRREIDTKPVDQEPLRERANIPAVKPSSQPSTSDDPFTAPKLKPKRMSMPGYDIIERRIRAQSRMRSETPASEHPAGSRRSESLAPDFSSRSRRASMGPQFREPTPAPERAPTVERDAPLGSEWVPSPGAQFQMDASGRLIYLGMADAAALVGAGGSPAVRTPTGAARSLQKVKEAAAATRGQTTPTGRQNGSPANSSRRGFVKPLVPAVSARSIKVEPETNAQDAQRNGARDPVGRMLDAHADQEKSNSDRRSGGSPFRHPQPTASTSRIPVRTNGTPLQAQPRPQNPTEARANNPSSTSSRSAIPQRSSETPRETSTSTTTNNPKSRKRPAPFDDSTVQRVPPNYRSTSGRRMSSSEVAAAAFSKARREGSARG